MIWRDREIKIKENSVNVSVRRYKSDFHCCLHILSIEYIQEEVLLLFERKYEGMVMMCFIETTILRAVKKKNPVF